MLHLSVTFPGYASFGTAKTLNFRYDLRTREDQCLQTMYKHIGTIFWNSFVIDDSRGTLLGWPLTGVSQLSLSIHSDSYHSNLLVFWYPIWPGLRLQWEKAGAERGPRGRPNARAVLGTPFGILSVYSENEPALGPAFLFFSTVTFTIKYGTLSEHLVHYSEVFANPKKMVRCSDGSLIRQIEMKPLIQEFKLNSLIQKF